MIARDRFGVKPLWYAANNKGVAVASEAKVLLAVRPELRRANPATLANLLVNKRLDLEEDSFYAGVSSLPPGCLAWCTPNGGMRIRRWYEPPDLLDRQEFDPKSLDRFSDLLQDAVAVRLRSDIPVGLTLSGGLDSTAILDAAHRETDGLTAFTSVYGEGDNAGELPWARVALGETPGVPLHAVSAASADWLGTLRRIVWHMDGPGFSPAVFPLWRIMENARDSNVPVVLEGQGADELLGGYVHHRAASLVDDVARLATAHPGGAARDVARAIAEARHTDTLKRLVVDATMVGVPRASRLYARRVRMTQALEPEFARLASSAGSGLHAEDRLSRVLHRDFAKTTLPAFLHYGDAISMAHSVETRLPFMDYRIVEFSQALASSWKVDAGQSKVILRKHLVRRGQGAVAARRDKRGYPTPANDWMAREGGALLREILLDRDACIAQYIRRPQLSKLIDRHAGGAYVAGDQIYAMLAAELWLQECVTGKRAPAALR